MDQWAEDIQGHVMELEDNAYTMRFGGARVLRWEILEAPPGNERATIVADLTKADAIPSESFDCIILTQALQYIYDLPAAIMTMERILRPGGVVLATLPGISQVSPFGMDRWGEYWRFTTASAQALFSERFPESSVTVEGHGNVLASIAFLHGLVTSELTKEELDHPDPKYQLLITVRAVKTHVM